MDDCTIIVEEEITRQTEYRCSFDAHNPSHPDYGDQISTHDSTDEASTTDHVLCSTCGHSFAVNGFERINLFSASPHKKRPYRGDAFVQAVSSADSLKDYRKVFRMFMHEPLEVKPPDSLVQAVKRALYSDVSDNAVHSTMRRLKHFVNTNYAPEARH